ncbi:MFS transporter [Bacillus sp. JCM 19041]|uniref:MFS transporter n=1 Tax=Bacillus sp. JCM 19041 TaxID=1460637 RepID=UPI0006D1A4CC
MEKKKEAQKPYVKRNMSLIISNQFLATLAESILHLMIIWFIYERTGSALYASGVMAVIMVTQIFVGPFMGVFVDRFEPKRAMQIGYGIMVMVGVILAISYIVAPSLIVLSIYIALILHNICAQWIGPAKSKLLPRIVGNPNVVKTNGLISSTGQTADLLGQSVSGFLIALIGFVGVVLMHSGVYLIASFLLIFVIDLTRKKQDASIELVEAPSKKRFFTEMREGYHILKENRPVFKSILLASALNLVTVASALTVVLVSDRYGASAVQFGIFNACGALGGIITGLLSVI